MYVAHPLGVAVTHCWRIIVAQCTLATQASPAGAELQVADRGIFGEEIFLADSPSHCYGREGTPTVVFTELGRAVGTYSHLQQVTAGV